MKYLIKLNRKNDEYLIINIKELGNSTFCKRDYATILPLKITRRLVSLVNKKYKYTCKIEVVK